MADLKNGGRAIIERDSVVVRFPIEALAEALEGAWAMRKIDVRYKVTNAAALAKEFVNALNDEDEQGTTLIHEMADQAFVDCIEAGAEGIDEHEDQDI